ncbi:cofilin [Coemansia sp. RSA 486]|nr:cofilin [Coemansia sp. RSA 486]
MLFRSSGIPVNDLCKAKFVGLKRCHLYRYVIFKINDDNKEIIVDHRYRTKKASSDASETEAVTEGDDRENTSNMDFETQSQEKIFTDFVARLPEDQCRYAVFDVEYAKGDVVSNKIVFISYSPDTAKIKPKMLYSASKDALTKVLDGIHESIQINDPDDLTLEHVQEKLLRV